MEVNNHGGLSVLVGTGVYEPEDGLEKLETPSVLLDLYLKPLGPSV